MRTSTITADFSSDPQTVWQLVTDNTRCDWRSDLSHIEVLQDSGAFVEHTKGGFSTTFRITEKSPCQRYAFDLHNQHLRGHWTGTFSKNPDGGTRIRFTEEIEISHPVMRLLSYLFLNLRKQQETYVADLRKALGE